MNEETFAPSFELYDDNEDRKSVVQGKSVDIGGRRLIKKKKKKKTTSQIELSEKKNTPTTREALAAKRRKKGHYALSRETATGIRVSDGDVSELWTLGAHQRAAA